MIVLKQTNMPLLGRKEITCLINHPNQKTPNREDIIKEIANKVESKEDLVLIKHIYTKYGSPSSKVICYVYKTKKDLDSLEVIKKEHKEKIKVKEDGKKEEAKEQKTK